MTEEKFIIHGGRPLKGEIETKGAKNAAFPVLAAALLTGEECVVENLPLIEDVFRMIEIMKSVGADVFWQAPGTLKIRASSLDGSRINQDIIAKFRGSVLLIGALLARCGKVKIACPGGCIIGARPIDVHLDAFSQAGVKVLQYENHFEFEFGGKPRQRTIILNEFSVTATANILLFFSRVPGKTIIKIADADYQIQELAKFLTKMGVGIEGIGTHTLIVEGKKKLKGVKHRLIYDPIEAGTFILAAAAAKGNVLVKNVEIQFLEFFLKKLGDFKIPLEVFRDSAGKGFVRVFPWKRAKIDKLQSLPYPGLATDLQNPFGVLATQTHGSTLIHDPLYDGRLKYLEELNKMGAEIYFADSHRAIINGPTKLYGTELRTFDLRGGAALIVAGIIAEGKTTINNIYQIDRGYEKIEERLQKLGADIKRIN